MRIDNLRTEAGDGLHRLAARVTWEEADRPPQDIFFETQEEFGSAMACRAEAFLAACLLPALWSPERRLAIDGEVCPEMLDNVCIVNDLVEQWFAPVAKSVAVEARPRRRAAGDRRRAGFFLSGGLGSIAALVGNRRSTPPAHPAYFKDGILVYGLEVEQERPFDLVVGRLRELARCADVTLIPVATNLRSLNPDWTSWWDGHIAAALSAVGHALGGRLSSITVASDYHLRDVQLHGSHPLVEPSVSSFDLKVRYADVTLPRVEKARRVAQWAPAMEHLCVCGRADRYTDEPLNCGDCETCIRTMLDFLAVGALDQLTAMPARELTPELIHEKCSMKPSTVPDYAELIEPLRRVGRRDLADAVEQLVRVDRCQDGWKGRLRRFDRERLNGQLWALRRALGTAGPSVAN